MITEVSSPGFILINRELQPVAFNSAALQILAYPTKSDHVHRPVLFLKDEIKTRLLKSNVNGDLQFAKDYISGRRRYICRSFRLDGATNTGESLAVCLLLERHCFSATEWSEALAQFDLTARELETVTLLVEGLTSKQIANRMNISPNTVKAFLRLVMVKMDVSTRSGIVGKIVGPHS